MGGERTGWALDADLATTRQAFESMSGQITLVPLKKADVVHSVWEYPLLNLDRQTLDGKRIICHICNDPLRTFEQSCMVGARGVIGLWVALSHDAENQLTTLRLPTIYLPYSVDTLLFQNERPAGFTRHTLRQKWNIPDNAYVISSFMRDSMGSDLFQPKPQKGADMLFQILKGLWRRKVPIHVLLAGPRRHWIRQRLTEAGIPFTFAGKLMNCDDNAVNILAPSTINELYHASDLHLVTSRWEGGPRAVIECAATRTRIISTPLAMASDILEPAFLFSDVARGIELIEQEIRTPSSTEFLEKHLQRVQKDHTPIANLPRFSKLYRNIESVAIYHHPRRTGTESLQRNSTILSGLGRHTFQWMRKVIAPAEGPGAGLTFGLWHEFHKPPYGGGNQFMMALKDALLRQGASVAVNKMSSSIDVHICNSAWFRVEAFLNAAQRFKPRMIHRVDGPIAIYRETGNEEDLRIYDLNARLATATVYQSGWCFRRLSELGYQPVSPVIIHNAVDPRIFHRKGRMEFSPSRKIKLIATAWSDNPLKGGPFYKWLETNLDWDRFEFTFVGRTKEQFTRVRHLPPQPSEALAGILREHDIFIAASQHETCSNALIEALACGLPAVYMNDAGNGELVQFGGLPFSGFENAMEQINRLTDNYEAFQSLIHVASIDEIACKYIELAKTVMEKA